eukprot:COSAG01_NODE_26752_length_704_cov_1.052893_1_plen_80_part_01
MFRPYEVTLTTSELSTHVYTTKVPVLDLVFTQHIHNKGIYITQMNFQVHLTGTENSLPKPSQLRSPNPKIRITGRRSQNT